MRQVSDKMAPLEEKRPTILKDEWTKSPQRSVDESSEHQILSPIELDPNQEHKFGPAKKRVSFRLSDIRRQSLTGSLPDLAKASEKDIQKSSEQAELELNIKREPLPEGSDVFRAVMGEIDSEADDSSSNENLSDSLNKSWNGTPKRASSLKAKFQSKAAAAIYAKIHPFPKYYEQAIHSNGHNRHAPSSVTSTSLSSPRTCTKSSHNMSGDSSSPRMVSKHNGSSSPRHNSSPLSSTKVSPLVSSDTRVSSEKVAVRRQLSTPGMESPSVSKWTQKHKKLGKSASLDG